MSQYSHILNVKYIFEIHNEEKPLFSMKLLREYQGHGKLYQATLKDLKDKFELI